MKDEKKLFVFDMDGTLLPNTTGMLEIAKQTGHLNEIRSLENLLLNAQIDDGDFTIAVLNLWSDLSLDTVRLAFDSVQKIKNIKEVLQKIKGEGNTSCLITASQSFFAEHFYSYGFDYIYSSKEMCINKKLVDPSQALRSKDKVIKTQQLCSQLGLKLEHTVAFGDSFSDVPLFKQLKHTVSVNGDHHIQPFASKHYVGDDLLEAYALVH